MHTVQVSSWQNAHAAYVRVRCHREELQGREPVDSARDWCQAAVRGCACWLRDDSAERRARAVPRGQSCPVQGPRQRLV